MDESLQSFAAFWHQNERKRSAIKSLLMHLIRRQIEHWPVGKLYARAARVSAVPVDWTQEFNLGSSSPLREELVETCVKHYQRRLDRLSFQELAELIDADLIESQPCRPVSSNSEQTGTIFAD